MFQDERSPSVTSSHLLHPLSPMPPSPDTSPPYPYLRTMKPEERGLCLIHLLLACTKNVAAGSLRNSNLALDYISHLASPSGDPMQRLAAHFTQALADRALKSLPGLHKALTSTTSPSSSDHHLAHSLFFQHSPFLKTLYLITNQSILESMEGEKMVHIIDLHASNPAQWVHLLRAFACRKDGQPHLRITGIHTNKEALDSMALQLTLEAENLDIPFQFVPLVTELDTLDFEVLRVKTGEALAISSIFQLHGVSTGFEGFVSGLRGLSPKIVVVAEQEADHNGESMVERTMEAMHYYAALFDCLESSLPRDSIERRVIEKTLFGEQIKDIVACEGPERKERHERLEKWVRRLGAAGFGRARLSHESVGLGVRFLESSSRFDGYRIKEEGGCVFLCWQDRPLFSVSSWRSRMFL